MTANEKFIIEKLKVTSDLKAQASETVFQLQLKVSILTPDFLGNFGLILKYYAVKIFIPSLSLMLLKYNNFPQVPS